MPYMAGLVLPAFASSALGTATPAASTSSRPREQSKSDAAAVLLTGIAESSTASRARMRLEQEVC